MSYKLAGVDWNNNGDMTIKNPTPLDVWYLLRDYIDKYTTLHLKEKTHIESVDGYSLEIIETALKELEEFKKCIDLKEAQFISTHNMSVIDTETFNQLVKNSQALEIIKSAGFALEFNERQNEWSLYGFNGGLYILIAQGKGVKQYELLKEVLL